MQVLVPHSKEGTGERNWGPKRERASESDSKQASTLINANNVLKPHFKVLLELPRESVMVDEKYKAAEEFAGSQLAY